MTSRSFTEGPAVILFNNGRPRPARQAPWSGWIDGLGGSLPQCYQKKGVDSSGTNERPGVIQWVIHWVLHQVAILDGYPVDNPLNDPILSFQFFEIARSCGSPSGCCERSHPPRLSGALKHSVFESLRESGGLSTLTGSEW